MTLRSILFSAAAIVGLVMMLLGGPFVAFCFFTFWLVFGLVFVVLYHLALVSLDGDFRVRSDVGWDLFATVIRVVVFWLFWPVIAVFDANALRDIGLLFLNLSESQREKNDELKGRLAAREIFLKGRDRYISGVRRGRARAREMIGGEERRKRLVELREDDPELKRLMLLIGVGTTSDGARELVRLYPEHHTVAEVAGQAEAEVALRRARYCTGCGGMVQAEMVRLPPPVYVKVLARGSDEVLVEGWALRGAFTIDYGACEGCGREQPADAGQVSEIGRTAEVLAAVKAGLRFRRELDEL